MKLHRNKVIFRGGPVDGRIEDATVAGRQYVVPVVVRRGEGRHYSQKYEYARYALRGTYVCQDGFNWYAALDFIEQR